MQACRAIVSCCILLGACRSNGPPRVGDGYPRDATQLAFLAAIQPAVESAGVRIERWSIGGDRLPTIQLNTEQASLFADRNVVGVVGHSGSRDAILGAAIYNRRGVPVVVPNATSRLVAASGAWTFTIAPNDSAQGIFIAAYALDSLHARRVSILYVSDEYGRGLRDGVRNALGQRGLALVDEASVPSQGCEAPANDELHRVIFEASLRRASPQVVVLAANEPTSWCLAEKIAAADSTIWIIGADGMDGAQLIPETVSRVPPRLRAVSFWTPGTDSLNAAFIARVRTALGRDPTSAEALQFDAFMLLAEAVRAVGNDRRAVRDWLASLGRTREPRPGVTGPLAFNAQRSSILRMNVPPQAR
jgi:branched-chain amino acid transport system substrate-binding protein